ADHCFRDDHCCFVAGLRSPARGPFGNAEFQRNAHTIGEEGARVSSLGSHLEMLKRFKQATLRSLKTSGVSTLVHNSRWRRQRLLILAYHGISLEDEHLWNG